MDTQRPVGYLRRDGAAKYLNVAPRTLTEWQRRRIIPFYKMGKRCVLFRCADLDRAMDRRRIDAAGA